MERSGSEKRSEVNKIYSTSVQNGGKAVISSHPKMWGPDKTYVKKKDRGGGGGMGLGIFMKVEHLRKSEIHS